MAFSKSVEIIGARLGIRPLSYKYGGFLYDVYTCTTNGNTRGKSLNFFNLGNLSFLQIVIFKPNIVEFLKSLHLILNLTKKLTSN